MNQCRSINNKSICLNTSSMIRRTNDICELRLLNHLDLGKIPLDCLIKRIPKKNYVIRMFEENKYFLTVNEPYTIQSFCRGKLEKIKIKTNGILSLEPNCHVKTSEFSILAHATFTTNGSISLQIPEMDLSKLLRETYGVETERKTVVITDHTEEFRHLAESIKHQRESEETRSTLSQLSDTTTNRISLSWAFFSTITIFTAIYIIKRKARATHETKLQDEPTRACETHPSALQQVTTGSREERFEEIDLQETKPNTKPRHVYR